MDTEAARPKPCPECEGAGTVEAQREQAVLEGFLGACRLPCPRCKMAGFVIESEIDCEAVQGRW